MNGLASTVLIILFGAGCGGASAVTSTRSSAETASAPAPKPGPSCPPQQLEAAAKLMGTCFETAVLGADVTSACGDALVAKGWTRDTEAETDIGGITGKTVACYRKP